MGNIAKRNICIVVAALAISLAACAAIAGGQAHAAELSAVSAQSAVSRQSTGHLNAGTRSVYLVPAGGGKEMLYTRNEETGAVKTLRTFKEGTLENWRLDFCSGDWVYLTRSRQLDWRADIYACNLNTGKLKNVLPKSAVHAKKGKYVVVDQTFRTDVGPEQFAIYKVGSGKLTKVRVLAKYGYNATIIGKYVYYGKATSSDMHKMSVYRCKTDGSAVKKLGGPWTSAKTEYSNGMVTVTFGSPDYCTMTKFAKSKKWTTYRYYYKTKKLVKQ